MPNIDLCFQGWARGIDIRTAWCIKANEEVDVTSISATELVQKLKSGELAVCLDDALDNCDSHETELFDYEESK